jgi:hypothetical protein
MTSGASRAEPSVLAWLDWLPSARDGRPSRPVEPSQLRWVERSTLSLSLSLLAPSARRLHRYISQASSVRLFVSYIQHELLFDVKAAANARFTN